MNKNPEIRRALGRERTRRYRARLGKDECRRRSRAQYAAHPERAHAASQRYREKNLRIVRQRDAAHQRQRRRANPEAARAYWSSWYALHKETERLKRRIYYAKNKDKWLRLWNPRRRGRMAGASGSFSVIEWRALVKFWSGWCAYCGLSGPLTADHRIPLSRGGTNSIENILPACVTCNCSKGTRTESEYRAVRLAALRKVA